MKIEYCDRCHAQLKPKTTFKLGIFPSKTLYPQKLQDIAVKEEMDLCVMCYQEFSNFLKGEPTLPMVNRVKQ